VNADLSLLSRLLLLSLFIYLSLVPQGVLFQGLQTDRLINEVSTTAKQLEKWQNKCTRVPENYLP
jgi:hypothetical protein